jgi:hypothetical protein
MLILIGFAGTTAPSVASAARAQLASATSHVARIGDSPEIPNLALLSPQNTSVTLPARVPAAPSAPDYASSGIIPVLAEINGSYLWVPLLRGPVSPAPLSLLVTTGVPQSAGFSPASQVPLDSQRSYLSSLPGHWMQHSPLLPAYSNR